jgi:hypothetical protein
MPKEEIKRAFESETLILPALKMVLVDAEKEDSHPSTQKTKPKGTRDLKEETVLRIIEKLAKKD